MNKAPFIMISTCFLQNRPKKRRPVSQEPGSEFTPLSKEGREWLRAGLKMEYGNLLKLATGDPHLVSVRFGFKIIYFLQYHIELN